MTMWSFVLGNALMAMLICGAISAAAWFYIVRRRLNVGVPGVIVIALMCMVWGVFWLKMFSIFEAKIASAVNGVLFFPGNMSLFGAVFLDPVLTLVIAKAKKINLRTANDIFCLGYLLPILFGRLNCFFAGCCVSDSFDYPIIGTIVWPIREIEVLFYLAFFVIFASRIIKTESNGEVYPLFMITYGALRFVLEWARETYYPIGPLHLSHIWALASAIIGLLLFKGITSTQPSVAVVGKPREFGGVRQ